MPKHRPPTNWKAWGWTFVLCVLAVAAVAYAVAPQWVADKISDPPVASPSPTTTPPTLTTPPTPTSEAPSATPEAPGTTATVHVPGENRTVVRRSTETTTRTTTRSVPATREPAPITDTSAVVHCTDGVGGPRVPCPVGEDGTRPDEGTPGDGRPVIIIPIITEPVPDPIDWEEVPEYPCLQPVCELPPSDCEAFPNLCPPETDATDETTTP